MKVIDKIKNFDAVIDAPASKAHTLRALIISSLANGECIIRNPLFGQDQLNVIACLKKLGVKIQVQDNKIIVHGTGGRYSPVSEEFNVGESGVGMNFLTSVACLSAQPVVLTGAKRITQRPILEVVNGLRQLGAKIEYLENEGFPPIKIYGGGIEGGIAKIKGQKTSQYFSSIVISSPYANNEVTLVCEDEMTEKPYFDISLQMMSEFGINAENKNYRQIEIRNDKKYSARKIKIEGDYSSASFFFLAGAVCQSKITVNNLNPDTNQGDKAFLTLMEQMGCDVCRTNDGFCIVGQELIAIEVDMSDVPDLVPPMAIAAAFAKGTSRFTNIGHLRHKECDRLAVMACELNKMGVVAKCDENSLTVTGNPDIHSGSINPHNDHRIAMSFAIAGLAVGEQTIEDDGCVAKSFPDFWKRFEIFAK